MDRYAQQRVRQNAGLPCSDCGSHQGHFRFCPVFELTMAQVLGRTDSSEWTPDDEYLWQTQVLKNVAPYLNDIPVCEFTEEDHVHAHGMGIKL